VNVAPVVLKTPAERELWRSVLIAATGAGLQGLLTIADDAVLAYRERVAADVEDADAVLRRAVIDECEIIEDYTDPDGENGALHIAGRLRTAIKAWEASR
jgi:hypothetical protein